MHGKSCLYNLYQAVKSNNVAYLKIIYIRRQNYYAIVRHWELFYLFMLLLPKKLVGRQINTHDHQTMTTDYDIKSKCNIKNCLMFFLSTRQ